MLLLMLSAKSTLLFLTSSCFFNSSIPFASSSSSSNSGNVFVFSFSFLGLETDSERFSKLSIAPSKSSESTDVFVPDVFRSAFRFSFSLFSSKAFLASSASSSLSNLEAILSVSVKTTAGLNPNNRSKSELLS